MASRIFDMAKVELKSLISWELLVGWETILQIDVVFVSTLGVVCCSFVAFLQVFLCCVHCGDFVLFCFVFVVCFIIGLS